MIFIWYNRKLNRIFESTHNQPTDYGDWLGTYSYNRRSDCVYLGPL